MLEPLTDAALDAWFVTPPRLGVASAWYGHVPFAFWLMQAARPRIFVELGTHNGVSYTAFCQAALDTAIDVRCYAVDTWRGDEHAGFYAEDVFADLQAFHDARYSPFSRLLRTTFDDAVASFADGSVDLLHIDGFHSYDVVSHDFETWRPKLSSRAIVVFHDINVRERGFGVWRLWAELSRQHPSFAFLHEHGLGVLAFGAELDGPAAALCRLTDPAQIATIRMRFAQSGQRCAALSERAQMDAALAEARRRVETGDAARQTFKATLLAAQQDAERLDLIAVDGERRAAAIRATLAQTEHELEQTRHQLAAARADLVGAHQQLDEKDRQVAYYRGFEQAYHVVTQSTMWRALQPLHKAARRVPRPVSRLVRLGTKAAWWAITPWRLSARLERRRALLEMQRSPSAPPPEPAVEVIPPPPVPPRDPFSLDRIATPDSGYVPLIKWYDPIAPEVSVIIANWHGGDMTLLCLQHLWQHTTGHRYEIIVVDNGSTPDEVARLQAQAPLVRTIALGVNQYFGEANNIGVEAARGRFICLLNNDAFVSPGWLPPLMQALTGAPGIGAVGPRFLDPDGTLQQAGGLIEPNGTLLQLGTGASADDPLFRSKRTVDYVSAACLLVRRSDFLDVLGFDLAWDPAYYEDADLCLKLRVRGLHSMYCPESAIVHFGGATSVKQGGALRLTDTLAINRAKFANRWGRYLSTMGAEMPDLQLGRSVRATPAPPADATRRVLIYTPYPITPGGGERYILTIAESFKDIAQVLLVTPQRVSRLRLLTMGREFGLDLDQVELLRPAELEERPPADLAFVLGNEIFPIVGGQGQHNAFICQFPFPFEHDSDATRQMPFWRDFELVLTYSDYVREHVLRETTQLRLPFRPVEVLAPPVPMVQQRSEKRLNQILHVGRFFTGGHCKRQDTMIDAFRLLLDQGVAAELHFAGSTMPGAAHLAYYAGLIERASGLPVHFHANCSTEELHRLYAESGIYWHATGVGSDVEALPHVVEHFGISVVEAMSARCIPIVFAAGGPATIVTDGVTGFHFNTIETLATRTKTVLTEMQPTAVGTMRDATYAAAQQYDEAIFRDRVRMIATRLLDGSEQTADTPGVG